MYQPSVKDNKAVQHNNASMDDLTDLKEIFYSIVK